MAQPVPWTRQSSFTQWSTSYPSAPHSGTALDAEFNAAKVTQDAIRTNLALLQRDDGQLANGIVHPNSLSAATKRLLAAGSQNYRGAWVTATAYALGDMVNQGDEIYIAVVAHTSGTFATDLAAVKWITLGVGSAAGGFYTPEQYGAVGNGVADDKAAIDAMIADMPDGGVAQFKPGSTYLTVLQMRPDLLGWTGKSITIIGYGATLKSGYDSTYNQLRLIGKSGSDDPTTYPEYCRIYGLTLDGDNQNQQYPPAPFGDYGDSPVGNSWREQDGNSGLLLAQGFRQIVFEDITIINPVRDGIVATDFEQAEFRRIRGRGQIPFMYQEMIDGGQTPRESAYIKTRFSTNDDQFLNTVPWQVLVDDASFDGGCMGYFHRTNSKGGQEAANLTIRKMRTRNISRMSIWSEVADTTNVIDCDLHGEYKPTNAYRNVSGGIFVGAGVRYSLIDKTQIRNGSIDFRNANSRQDFTVRDCFIYATATNDSDPVIVNATSVINTTIRNKGTNSNIDANTYIGGGTRILEGGAVTLTGSRSCVIDGLFFGRETQALTDMSFTVTDAAQSQFDLLAEDANLHSIFEVFHVEAGMQPEIVGPGRYSYDSGTGILNFTVDRQVLQGDGILVRYVAKTVDEFEAASGTTFDTSIRASSIVSVTVAGSPITAGSGYTTSRNSDNTVRVTLAVGASSEDVVVTSLPWWQTTVGNLNLGQNTKVSNLTARGFSSIRVQSGDAEFSNCDIQLALADERGALNLADTTLTNLKVTGGYIGRCIGPAVNIADAMSGVGTIELNGTTLFDCGLDGSLTANGRAYIGGIANGANGKHLMLRGVTFHKRDGEIGASDMALITRASVLTSVDVSGDCRAFNMNATPMTLGALVTGGRYIRDGAIFSSGSFNPASLADGARESTTRTVTGAELGDLVRASFSVSLAGVELVAYVSSADTVTALFINRSGGTVDLASGTLSFWVTKSRSKLL